MKNGDMPIIPMGGIVESTESGMPQVIETHGLTKREYAAIEIAKGLSSATNQDGTWATDADSVSTMAIEYADKLLEEMEKE